MNRRQMLASIAASSAAAVGATTLAGATEASADGSGGTYYRITHDDAGERIVREVTADEVDLSSDDICYVDCCQYCPPAYACSPCVCHGPCPIE